MQFEPYEIEKLTEEIVNLSKLLTDDTAYELNTSCQNLNTMIDNLNIKIDVEENFSNLKNAISDIQSDTITALDNIKTDLVSGSGGN